MKITLIVAMDNNKGIGFQNTIPWMGKIPSDMKHFKETTTGHAVIMGKNTYLSMGRALPNRANIVLSRSMDQEKYKDIQIAPTLDRALELASTASNKNEVFIIGGAQVYSEALARADKLIVTFVDGIFATDTYFPEIDTNEWVIENEQVNMNERDLYSLRFVTFIRKTAS